ncbi:hypothetical protein BDF22DRAFT_664514 [Syncephalis plumigaleata]|nr:hypothetical protein BDF22DRAFT_664514 [Syncephalis plumigaleata]
MFLRLITRAATRSTGIQTRTNVYCNCFASHSSLVIHRLTNNGSSSSSSACSFSSTSDNDASRVAALLPRYKVDEALLQFRAFILRGQINDAWHLYTTLQRQGQVNQLKAEDHSRLLQAEATLQSNLFTNGTINGRPLAEEDEVNASELEMEQVQCARVLQILNNFAVHQYQPDMRDFSAALLVLGRRGIVADVEDIWNRMMVVSNGNGVQPSRFAWNARLDAHVRARAVSSAYQIVRDMHKYGVIPDSLTYDLLGDLQGLVGHPEGTARLLRQRLEAANFTGFETLLVSEMTANDNDTTEYHNEDSDNAARIRFKRKASSTTSNRMAELEFPLPPPTVHTFNRAIRAYKRAGDVEGATRIYRLLTELIRPPPDTTLSIKPNVSTYNEFMAAQYQAEFNLHLELLERMRKNDIAPDAYTYHLLIKYACWTRAHWVHVERLWREMREKDIQPLGRTCKVIYRRLKRPQFEQLRKEAYEIWQASQDNSGTRAKLAF